MDVKESISQVAQAKSALVNGSTNINGNGNGNGNGNVKNELHGIGGEVNEEGKGDVKEEEVRKYPLHPALMTSRVFLKRLKDIALALRTPMEPIKAVEAAAAGRVKPKSAVKANVSVLKTMHRWGRPMDMYEALTKVLRAEKVQRDKDVDRFSEGVKEDCRSMYLFTWSDFSAALNAMKEGGTEADTEDSTAMSHQDTVTAWKARLSSSSSSSSQPNSSTAAGASTASAAVSANMLDQLPAPIGGTNTHCSISSLCTYYCPHMK